MRTKTLILPFKKTFALGNFFRLENISESVAPNCATFVNRHDHHNIELKSVFEINSGAFESELDVYLFVPRSFAIKLEERLDPLKDIRSRLRLAIPYHGDVNNENLKFVLQRLEKSIRKNLDSSIEMLLHNNEQDSGSTDHIVEDARDLCAVVTESFKKSTNELSKLFFISHNLMSNLQMTIKSLAELSALLQKKSEIMAEVRKVIVTSTSLQVLQLLDEYLSYVYIQYLSAIRYELDQTEPAENIRQNSDYANARQKLEDEMTELQEKEAAHRYQVGLKVDYEESEKDREQRLMRLSHLKKFFQSKSFVEFSTKNNVKRIYESLATLGTAIAGVTVAVLESFRNTGAAQTTFKGIFLLSFGVFAYVLRDRLKDWIKSTLTKKASIYIPDTESNLWAKNKKMGVLKEWLRIENKNSIPASIIEKRQNLAGCDLQKALPEDILHYRKIQSITHAPSEIKSSAGLHAVHENIRINLERYLKHMDDPFKDLAELDAWGALKKSKSHRVYHFYLCARIKYKSIEASKMDQLKALTLNGPPKPPLEKIVIARLVLDKNGVVRVEEA